MSKITQTTLLAGALAAMALTPFARAAELTRDQAQKMCQPTVNVGDITPYGETPAEAARKKITFEWTCQIFVDGDAAGAFKNYVDPNFCDHGHLVTHGKRDCGSYAEVEPNFARMAKMSAAGGTMEIPVEATVDGEMVTMYGAGVDIFRVHNGKITDHWDASPPDTTTIKAHPPGTAARVMSGEGPPPRAPGS